MRGESPCTRQMRTGQNLLRGPPASERGASPGSWSSPVSGRDRRDATQRDGLVRAGEEDPAGEVQAVTQSGSRKVNSSGKGTIRRISRKAEASKRIVHQAQGSSSTGPC